MHRGAISVTRPKSPSCSAAAGWHSALAASQLGLSPFRATGVIKPTSSAAVLRCRAGWLPAEQVGLHLPSESAPAGACQVLPLLFLTTSSSGLLSGVLALDPVPHPLDITSPAKCWLAATGCPLLSTCGMCTCWHHVRGYQEILFGAPPRLVYTSSRVKGDVPRACE